MNRPIMEYMMRRPQVAPYMYTRRPMEDMRRGRRERGMEDNYTRFNRGYEDKPLAYEGRQSYDKPYNMDYDMGYDMPYGPYYNIPMTAEYRGAIDFAGEQGLTKDEIAELIHKFIRQVDEKDKQFFSRETIERKARDMGISFDKFNIDELILATLMEYGLHCMTLKPLIGSNMDVYIKLGKDFLTSDNDGVKGGEKLALYYDYIIRGKDY